MPISAFNSNWYLALSTLSQEGINLCTNCLQSKPFPKEKAKLKPINNETQPHYKHHNHLPKQIKPSYLFNSFYFILEHLTKLLKPQTRKNMPLLQTNTKSATSIKSTKIPIDPLPPDHYYNCQSRNVAYIIL